jgi:GH43 family beta-xylosidase
MPRDDTWAAAQALDGGGWTHRAAERLRRLAGQHRLWRRDGSARDPRALLHALGRAAGGLEGTSFAQQEAVLAVAPDVAQAQIIANGRPDATTSPLVADADQALVSGDPNTALALADARGCMTSPTRRRLITALAIVTGAVAASAPAAAAATGSPSVGLASPWSGGLGSSPSISTDATYFNNAALPAADPYVLHDPRTGYYYAYSTEGADPGYDFAIYRSADLVTWEKAAPGALPVNDPNQWGTDWFWAPETYYNPRTGLYFMFYAARSAPNAQGWFGYANYEEPCKIGVAVSRSPAGPFHNIANHPIDYNPYDPGYHDVNLIMGPDQMKPPATLQQGETAPLGTYIPQIDPDVLFDGHGRMVLYYSRNAYRNWVWDTDLQKYIEESTILAVPLTSDWWNDPTGTTMPTIAPAYRGSEASAGGPSGPRRDGWVRVVDYDHDKQAWENADVNDYTTTGGQLKDRRWEEGATVLKTSFAGRTRYYLTYSANNSQGPQYAVGYAVSDSPLGPFHKSPSNPILQADPAIGEYSTGHGSIVASPDGSQLYYVHHGRPTPTDPQRRLYTDEMHFSSTQLDPWGNPLLSIDEATSDRPVPSGVAPYRMRSSARRVVVDAGTSAPISWQVLSAAGVPLALANPLNRVTAAVADPGVATVTPGADDASATVTGGAPGRTVLTLTYQRQSSGGAYNDVHQGHRHVATVALQVPVTVRR